MSGFPIPLGLIMSYQNPYAPASPDNESFRLKNCLLEPSCIEKMQIDAFNYPVTAPKYLLASFATALGAGRAEVRDPSTPLLLNSDTLTGLQANATALILNPNVNYGKYAKDAYYRRQNILNTLPLKYLGLTGPSLDYPFIAGPYGSLAVQLTVFDLTWIVAKNFGTARAYNLSNELGDTGITDYQRTFNALSLIMSKSSVAAIGSGAEKSAGVGLGSLSYYVLPSNWGTIDTLNNGKYVFRDDFMGATLNPTVWNLTQSTPGNVAINTDFACVKGIGTNVWGTNGMRSVAVFNRSAGLRYVADAWVGSGPSQTIFGLSDGLGVSFANFVHGMSVSDSGIAYIDGGGFNGAAGVTADTMYRFRITCGTVGGALYEIQGGPVYPAIGDSVWFALADTRGNGTVNATFKLGYTPYPPASQIGGSYLSDVRVY